MKLTRKVPSRTEVAEFTWIKHFMLFEKLFEVRQDKTDCWWCKQKFKSEDMVFLAGRPKHTNVLLCQSCATEAEKEE